VWISSASFAGKASRTLSIVASDVSTKSAEVPGVIFSRTSFTKPSSMPMWVSDPASAPVAAPTANPSSGTKKMRPKRKPQNAPPRAPAPVRLLRCRVLGFFLPSGQVTMAASWTLIVSSDCSRSSVPSAVSAPSAVCNFQTVKVATRSS